NNDTPEVGALASECYHTYDVVIVGAGIIGLSIARHFLLHSRLSVAIVDASTPLSSGATGAGQGYLCMIHKTPGTALWDLAKRSQQLWQMFVDNLQDQGISPLQSVGWKKTGSVLVGRTKEETEQLKIRVHQLSNAGLRAEYWSSSNLRLKEPELTVGPEGCAAFLPDDAQIEVHSAVALIEKDNIHFIPHNRYAEFYNDPAVCLMRSSKDGKVDAVKTNNNNILHAKEAVVIAAGSWTGSLMHNLARDLDVTINVPVQPRKGYLLVFENIKSNLRLNHATMEAGYVNYQRTSTENSSKSTDISMTATIDAKGNLLVVPDGKPVIGPIPSMPNVYLATGHEGGGISMALGTAELIADMVLGNSLKLDPTPFAVEGRCC
uniref:FAD-dependent oxidoreductase domain-containing protein 1 n=1 Tax=Chenopodium quinoa TaxID=63459 RepID=A0A803MC78_CHEQI